MRRFSLIVAICSIVFVGLLLQEQYYVVKKDYAFDIPTSNTKHSYKGDNKKEEPVVPSLTTEYEQLSELVNAEHKLPEQYIPTDLVYPNVRFIFDDLVEKRMLREVAAHALEAMFAAAETDGIYLAGVSGYRSHETQRQLFNYYVMRDGFDKASTYSAQPGTSEHETGLAIDISGVNKKCAAQDCFGQTAEALWIEKNCATFGFIIRYPKGMEAVTGYKYEPWHLRYVGIEIAQYITKHRITLEHYYSTE